MFSFASNNLRASKHGNFSSVDSGRLLEERSPKMAIMRDGTKLQNVRTVLLSRWITRRLDQMTTLTRWVQYIRLAHVHQSLQTTFSSTMTVHTDLSVIRDRNVAFIITSPFIGVTIHVYINVLTWRTTFFFTTNSKHPLLLVMLLFRNSINQSINQCSEPHFVA